MKKYILFYLIIFVSLIKLNLSAQEKKNIKNNIEQAQLDKNTKKESKEIQSQRCPIILPSLISPIIQKISYSINNTIDKWKKNLSSIFDQTSSSWIRFIIALLLGILLSLTPCIYPMIPITIGVLQINQTKSAFQSFLMATSYTFGISITFAVFGFIAALGSCVFGQLQGSIWIVLPLVALLFYFGFSMFGFYEIYIPKFLQPKVTKIKGGSYLSALIFGIISGSVASPCLSPGLLLILDYVSNIGFNGTLTGYIEGLILLFIFGIGSSLPLLIIGTFSGSINLMPQAGPWMIEIKKIFGLMLIFMAFYHLSHLEKLISWHILVWIIVACILALSIHYIKNISKYDSRNMHIYKIIMAFLLFVIALITAFQGYKSLYIQQEDSIWLTDYELAQSKALKENKLIFIDIGATYCASCKALDNKIFKNPRIIKTLNKFYVPIKVESDINEKLFQQIQKLYSQYIKGFPTFLSVNPKNNIVLKRWTEQLGDLEIEQVINEFEVFKK